MNFWHRKREFLNQISFVDRKKMTQENQPKTLKLTDDEKAILEKVCGTADWIFEIKVYEKYFFVESAVLNLISDKMCGEK